jgi:polysaccharide export outer membrane protein
MGLAAETINRSLMNTVHASITLCSAGIRRFVGARKTFALIATASLCLLLNGCGTPPAALPTTRAAPDVQTLNPGDTVKISFPGTPSLDQAPQQIRRDGRLNLYLIGEVKAADKTPAELEKELTEAYAPQLTSKDVKVTVVSSSLAVYVNGAVLRPGKVLSERPLTAFDAIMEAGGLDASKADAKNVKVIRIEAGQAKHYPVNMKAILDGVQTEMFYLKPYDIVQVPEKFSWF